MIRRLVFFGLGCVISLMFLSLGPENRLKETFIAYINYFNINKRVIYHLDKGEAIIFSDQALCQMLHYNLSRKELLSVLHNGEVNFNLSDNKSKPNQLFVIENMLNNQKIAVRFSYFDVKEKVQLLSFWYKGDEEKCIY
jgi:hypothetical protein